MSRLDTIATALERLRDAYQRDDADAIDEASRELDELGHLALAVEGLDPLKRAAIECLAFRVDGWERYRTSWTDEAIARVLMLPVRIVASVIGQAERDDEQRRRADEEAEAARYQAIRERDRELELRARTVACPVCGADAGKACRTTKRGRPCSAAHADRAIAAGIPRRSGSAGGRTRRGA